MSNPEAPPGPVGPTGIEGLLDRFRHIEDGLMRTYIRTLCEGKIPYPLHETDIIKESRDLLACWIEHKDVVPSDYEVVFNAIEKQLAIKK